MLTFNLVFTNITPAWALSTFGFISAAMIPIPFLLYIFGLKLRSRSRYAGEGMMTEGQAMIISEEVENATV